MSKSSNRPSAPAKGKHDGFIIVPSYIHWRTGKPCYRKDGGLFRFPRRR